MKFRLTITLVLLAATPTFAEDKKPFRAGAHAQDITPSKFPVSVNGNMSDIAAKGSIDTLHARCLVLDDGKTQLAIVVVDSCMVPREITDAARSLAEKATKIPSGNILISATHTHTAPTVTGVFQSEPNPDYVKELPGLIAKGIAQAQKNLEPAQIGWAVAENPRQVFNRRWFRVGEFLPPDPFGGKNHKVQMNPGYQAKGLIKSAGPVDPSVYILSVRSLKERPIALLANYSLHYVGGTDALSADYFGAFAERVKVLLKATEQNPAFVGIMSNGTSGDVNNVNFGGPAPGKREKFEQIRVVANDVADTAMEALKKVKYHNWVSLDAATTNIELGVRRPNEKEVDRANGILEQAKGRALKGLEEVYARETVLMAKYPEKVKVMLQALRIGELSIGAIPCEVFAEIGLELRKNSPLKDHFTISLANGYNGYLPTPAQHKLGGYETWRARSSYLEVDASPKVIKEVLGLVVKVSKSR